MFNLRASGILLHPTSLPSSWGVGDLGDEAYRFVDFLSENYQQVWQILPIGPTRDGHSPYSSYSSLAGNSLLISLEKLANEGLLTKEDLSSPPQSKIEMNPERVNYDKAIAIKNPRLKLACQNFLGKATSTQKQQFQEFCQIQAYWLDDYALFMAIKEDQKGASWNKWPSAIAKRLPEAIDAWNKRLGDAVYYHKFLQFQFFRQWQSLKQYANNLGIKIFGDISFYVAHDSADVWANPEIFCLDPKGEAKLMGGVPPDYFSNTGQLWGNPVYDWSALEKTNFAWWVQRIKGMLGYVDFFRIDHFRGMQAFWAVEQGEKTAENGKWLEASGEKLFELLEENMGRLPIVAEDLGTVTPQVEALRDKFDFPGMKILQFAFDSKGGEPKFLPYNFDSHNCIVYTGTHDNDTTIGWFEKRSPQEKAEIFDYLDCTCSQDIHWSFIRMAMSSIANFAIFPFQDVLGLGSEAKMNTPGEADCNWSWRYRPEALSVEYGDRLKHLTSVYGRAPQEASNSHFKIS